jgi:hypothetical protein
MALAFYSQMGWFHIIRMEWDEAKKEKTITLEHTVEAEAFGTTEKCLYAAGLLAESWDLLE